MLRRFALFVMAMMVTAVSYADRIPMYHVFHPGQIDHFYTTDAVERSQAIANGYEDHGIAFYVEDSARSGAVPLYRTYKGAPQTDHFYTTNANDVALVVSWGWVQEENEGYVFPTEVTGARPIYRFSYWDDPSSNLTHFYSINDADVYNLPNYGWSYEGIMGYGFSRAGVADNFKAAILAYHTGEVYGCNAYATANYALKQDLQMMYNNGFTVVPLRWMIGWGTGTRPSTSMPSKPVAITFDDGPFTDWYDGHPACPGLESARTVLVGAANAYPGLFADMPYATSFVIASPATRALFGYMPDDWWGAAKASGIIDIQNHSTDHDTPAIQSQMFETNPYFDNMPLAVGGIYNGNWAGEGSFCRIGMSSATDSNGWISAWREIVPSGNFIASKTGAYPDIFAYPQGGLSSGLRNYLASFGSANGLSAGLAAGPGYVFHNGHWQFDIPRFLHNGDWAEGGLLSLLNGNGAQGNRPPMYCP